MFDATNIVKINDKSKYLYNGCGIAVDEEGSWSFGNVIYFPWKIVLFGVDNSSSS